MSKKPRSPVTSDPKDKLYALVNYKDKEENLCYILARNPIELWNRIIELEWFGTGMTKEMLSARGWIARPARIRVFKNQPKEFCSTCGMARAS
jgi:hypothetical protein